MPTALGGHVVRGSVWMMMNTAAGKGASLVAQVVLAWLLTKEDFGVFATASSAAIFATFLRDGGVRDLLIQKQLSYDQLAAPMFWLAGAMNLVCGLVVVLIGLGLAVGLDNPVYFWMLLLIGVSVPLNTAPSILSARLSIDMRFGAFARIQIVSALIRYGGSVALAAAGFGPVAFVLPLPVMAVVETILLMRTVGTRPWKGSPQAALWPSLLRQAKWILLGTLGIALVNMGNYSVVRVFVDDETVGVYFFAYQIVAQIGVLVAANMNQVLFAAFAKIEDPERLRRGIERAIRQLIFFGAPASLALIPTFPGIQQWLWPGKWDEAVLTVLIVAALYPLSTLNAVPYAVLQARGRFRMWAILLTLIGCGMLAAGAIAAWLTGAPEWIGGASASVLSVGAVLMALVALRGHGVGAGVILKNSVPIYVVALISAGAALLVDRELAAMAAGKSGAIHLVRAIASAGVFGVLFLAAASTLLRAPMAEALQLAPARFKALFLRTPFLRRLGA